MDVKKTLLNGVIEEEVYIENYPGFETHDKKTHVWRLIKALYGLNKAPRAWYGRIDGFQTSLVFTNSKEDSKLYYKVVDEGLMILFLYVDDIFLTSEEKIICECKKKLPNQFEIKDICTAHYFISLEVWEFHDDIFLNQRKYIVEILKRFGMLDCKENNTSMVINLKLLNDDASDRVDVTLYLQIIGSLMYLKNTIPYICFDVNTLSQYIVDPWNVHLVAAKMWWGN